ncbi:trans-sialidase [Trypanosoma cruzi]|nr:trans-sialidase [Trypanosoma cruzi]
MGSHTVLAAAGGKKRLDDVHHPTTIAKSNKVFLLAKSSVRSHANEKWKWDGMDLKLVVGNVKNSTDGEPSKRISWDNPQSLLSLKNSAASYELKFERVFPSGGSGVVMEDGTPVFPVVAFGDNDVCSIIIYSTDNGSAWALSEDISPAECLNPASPSGRDHFS